MRFSGFVSTCLALPVLLFQIFLRVSSDCGDTVKISEALNIFQFLSVQLDLILLFSRLVASL